MISHELTLTKSTKNKHVYTSLVRAVSAVYINKDSLPSPPPQRIQLQINEVKI